MSNKLGRCINCESYWVKLEGGMCEKCREKHIARCEKLAQRQPQELTMRR